MNEDNAPSSSAAETAVATSLAPLNRESQNIRVMALAIVLCAFAVIAARCAWLSDDAFITFRQIDNLLHGYGLRWNVAERVQGFTHPLWLLFLTPIFALTGEFFYTAIVTSILVSIIALNVASRRLCSSVFGGVLLLVLCTSSKAFVDYATSGLENPLSHLLLVYFLMEYYDRSDGKNSILTLTLILALAHLTRPDAVVLLFPMYAAVTLRLLRSKKTRRGAAFDLVLGVIPVLAWYLFALLYFGFPFPNTAYAKLGTGIPRSESIAQGLFYIIDSLSLDPMTLLVVVAGIVVPFVLRDSRSRLVSIGIACQVVYVIWIGGDFMSGRFLTTSFLAAAIIIARRCPDSLSGTALVAAPFVAIALAGPYPPFLTGEGYRRGERFHQLVNHRGIADERGYYYSGASLLVADRSVVLPNHRFAWDGRRARAENVALAHRRTIGYFGFFAGPAVHVVDELALTEPLLARLPAIRIPDWRIGHCARVIPPGYDETLTTGENRIGDKELSLYYEKLRLIVRGDIWSWERLKTIIGMNLGRYDHLINEQKYAFPFVTRLPLAAVSRPLPAGAPWNAPGTHVMSASGIEIDMPEVMHARRVELTIDNNDAYEVVFLLDDERLEQIDIPAPFYPLGLALHVIDVPPAALAGGFKRLHVFPLNGDGKYSLGHLRLSE